MCNCINIEMGSYANQTVLQYPNWFVSSKKSAGIDNCILEEIKGLWESGVQTTESCCGHNKSAPYIAVVPEHAEAMRSLGYKDLNVWNGVDGFFEPKSIYPTFLLPD